MKKRRTQQRPPVPTVHYMGSIHLFVIAGGSEPTTTAIETVRSDRPKDDPFWDYIKELTPAEFERLNGLMTAAIAKLKEPGDLNPFPPMRK